MHLFFRAAAVTLGLLASAPLQAQESHHRTDYEISILGLTIATATFETTVDGKAFSISGRYKSAGLAKIAGKTSGTSTVSGIVGPNGLNAVDYTATYKAKKRTSKYDMTFSNGALLNVSVTPQKKKKRPKNWIPVTAADLAHVADPLTGLVITGKGSDVCSRTIPIFDGETRMDLVLSKKGSEHFKIDGYEGDASVCKVKIVPKSGFRKGREDLEYLAQQTTTEIWFAKAEGSDLYAPVVAKIPTRYGTLTVSATRFGA